MTNERLMPLSLKSINIEYDILREMYFGYLIAVCSAQRWQNVWSVVNDGVVEWGRALDWDWRPGGPGFECRCGNFASELWKFHLYLYSALPVSFGGDTNTRRVSSTWCLSQGK